MSAEWLDLPNLASVTRRAEYEVSIREWEPGDGLLCRWSAKSLAVPCGEPVAVVQRRRTDTSYRPGRYGKEVERFHHSVVCSLHAAEVVRQFVTDQTDARNPIGIVTEAQRIAREAVIAAHWDEYQRAVAANVEAAKDEALAHLPESFRKYFIDNGAVAS